ncbi:hypothetical protein MMAGJ_63320 [Mycolicibacterium mageritense]|uniref:Uncharacterized protein n=1 Tax=Mycolicibacterium mageritense TaxID=53462 RepID=A0ABM7I2C6_MYCME|nr:hypothetical protein MMAGJ_63320 [Mycolicibacterium mageritense]
MPACSEGDLECGVGTGSQFRDRDFDRRRGGSEVGELFDEARDGNEIAAVEGFRGLGGREKTLYEIFAQL